LPRSSSNEQTPGLPQLNVNDSYQLVVFAPSSLIDHAADTPLGSLARISTGVSPIGRSM
jgi:hypothetical protein